jgi:phage gp46-like protein
MTDIAFFYSEATMTADFGLEAGELSLDAGLRSAVVISLFTDRRAEPDDRLPDGAGGDRRGWWGDLAPPTVGGVPMDGDRIGSRLWLLSREKQVQEVLNRAREYAAEALQWLIDDGIAQDVEIETSFDRPGLLALLVTITRPPGDAVEFRFSTTWRET